MYIEIKEIHERKYVYERTSYRRGDRVLHTNHYVGPLVRVYKTSTRTARRIINAIVRQIRSPRNQKNATVTIILHLIEQLHEDSVIYWKEKIKEWSGIT